MNLLSDVSKVTAGTTLITLAIFGVELAPAGAASLGNPINTVNNDSQVAATWKWGDYQVGTHEGIFAVNGKPWKLKLTITVQMGGNNNFVLSKMEVEAEHNGNVANFDKNVIKNLQEGQSDFKDFSQPHNPNAKDVYALSYNCCGMNMGENNAIFTITGEHQAIPEPLTLMGAGTAFGFGAFFKRELSTKPKKDKEKA